MKGIHEQATITYGKVLAWFDTTGIYGQTARPFTPSNPFYTALRDGILV
jgi:hypothetical protein